MPPIKDSNLPDNTGFFPKAVFWMLGPYIFVSAASSYFLQHAELSEHARTLCSIGMFVVFVALAILFSLWFLSCFSGADTLNATQTARMFYFAYTFTITSFVVLLIPIANPWQPDIIGPVSLVRGCVLAPDKNEDSVPGAVRCSRSEVRYLSTDDRSAYPTAAQSKEVTPVRCSEAKSSESCVEKDTYPWLITLGGFNGITVETRTPTANVPNDDTNAPGNTRKAQTPELSQTTEISDRAKLQRADIQNVSIIQGGFVVPFYIVLLAFVGGAVSLTRRIPEYQKRAELHYEPTPRQPKLSEFEVREVVVFQIMQLISAPFIAIVAFYALAPASMATAIGLAFLSGFASEVILLQVRGIIEGLQPHATAFNNPTNMSPKAVKAVAESHLKELKIDVGENPRGEVSGVVQGVDSQPMAGVEVWIEGGDQKVSTLEDGSFTLTSVGVGKQVLNLKRDIHEYKKAITVKPGKNDLSSFNMTDD